jgi:hypothetical protein
VEQRRGDRVSVNTNRDAFQRECNVERCAALTSSLLDCFFLVSDSGLDTEDITSCRKGEAW